MTHLHPGLRRQAVLLVLCSSAFSAAAQTPATPPAAAIDKRALTANPLDAAAAVPPLPYRPAFAGFKGVLEQPLANWKDSNDRTAQVGGWRTYAKQAQAPESMTDQSKPAAHGTHKTP